MKKYSRESCRIWFYSQSQSLLANNGNSLCCHKKKSFIFKADIIYIKSDFILNMEDIDDKKVFDNSISVWKK